MGGEQGHSVFSNAQTAHAVNEGVELRAANWLPSVSDRTLSKVQGPHAESARRAENPGRLLQSVGQDSTVARGAAVLEDRFAAGVNPVTTFRDISHQNN